MNEILWTGDPTTQTYQPWLREAMTSGGKLMAEVINGAICLRFADGGAVVWPGEMIDEARCSAAPRWFKVLRPGAKQKETPDV